MAWFISQILGVIILNLMTFFDIDGPAVRKNFAARDPLAVRVAGVNLQEGKISFLPAEIPTTSSRTSRPRKIAE